MVYEFIGSLPKDIDTVIRFEGLAGEYLQFDFGTISNPNLLNEHPNHIFFFAARLKYSRTLFLSFVVIRPWAFCQLTIYYCNYY
jgi:transposase